MTDSNPEGVTVSLGISQFEPEYQVNDLLRKADEALYASKEKGRNRTEIFPPAGGCP